MKQVDKRTLYIGGLVVLGLISTYLITALAIPRVLVTLTKAAPSTNVSIKDSYIIGEVVLAPADGKTANKVNVFVLDKNSKGVSGKRVILSTTGGQLSPESAVSDEEGKTSFKVTSDKEEQVELSATVEGMPLDNNLKVTFRN